MAKITLGTRPKNFKSKVNVDLIEGGKGAIEISYIYRTRTQFGSLIDELFTDAGVKPRGQAEEEVRASMKEALEKTRDTNAEYIMKIADGWDIDGHDFTVRNVQQLCDELPGAALAIMDRYRSAITEGRLGN